MKARHRTAIGIEARGRQRRAPHHPRAQEAAREADDGSGGKLEDDDAGDLEQPGVADGPRRDDADQHDRGRVVEPRLRLEHTGQPLGQRHHAQDREHGGRVRRGADRAEQDRQLPGQAEEVVAADRDDRDRHRDSHRGQRDAQPDAGTHLSPVGGEATLGEDDRQGAEAQRVGQLSVLEGDGEGTGLTEEDADEQVDQQRGQPGTGRDPHREDGRKRHHGPDQHEQVELVDVEGHGHLVRGLRGAGGDPIGGRVLVRPSADCRNRAVRDGLTRAGAG